jgi:RNA polymerase sigma factor (sigma-70 family)
MTITTDASPGERHDATTRLRRAAQGDQEAWRALVQEHNAMLWSVTRGFRLGDQQAADVVQTTWLRLVEHIRTIRSPECLPGWLRKTAYHLCIGVINQQRRLAPLTEQEEATPGPDDPELSALRHDRRDIVRRALERLPRRDRDLLALLAAPTVSYARISRTLDMPRGSIGPTRARALQRLRAELAASDLVDASWE